uniref:C-factor n=1 Tax=Magallana gigas TaxID=29159 RepID=K1PWI9_MAGGI
MKKIATAPTIRAIRLRLSSDASTRLEFVCAELQEVAKSNSSITIMKLDVSEMNTIEEAKKLVESKVGAGGLNLLINNAGINKKVTLETVTPDMMLDTFNINVNGPLFTTKAFLPLLLQAAESSTPINPSSAVVNISTIVASIALNESTTYLEYRVSKTALNMLCKILHNELKAKGIHVGCLHPGWVQTDMGTAKAPVTVSQSVCGCIQAFLPLLLQAARSSTPSNPSSAIVNMSSIMSSIARTVTSDAVEYRVSKSALNMLTKILHNELKDKGIHVGCLHPGWVQTDMGTAKAPVTVSQSVCGCIQVMSNMNAENACVLTDYTGNPLPW